MNNKKLIKLITPIAAVASLATCTAFTACTTDSSGKDEKQPKGQKLLNFEAGPNNLDLNSELTPLTIVNDDTDVVSCLITIPSGTNTILRFRESSPSSEEGWTDWKTCTDQQKLTLEKNTKIQFIGYNSIASETGKVFSTQDKQFNIKFDGYIPGKGEVQPSNANISIGGSAYSLLMKQNGTGAYGDTLDSTASQYAFANLFKGSTNIKNVYRSFFPFESVVPHCYEGAFQDCSNLVEAPALYATTHNTGTAESLVKTNGLAEACYKNLFNGCSKLHTAPVLPARILAADCYNSMFQGCSSLTSLNLGYVGNFNKRYFNNWVHGVNLYGKIYYNGLDANKSNSEIPLHYSVISQKEEILSKYTKTITFESGDLSKFEEDKKLKVRAYNDSTLGEVIDGSLSTMSARAEAVGDSVWYYHDSTGSKLNLTQPVSELDLTKNIVGNYSEPSEFVAGKFNIKVERAAKMFVTWKNQYGTFTPSIYDENAATPQWTPLTNVSTNVINLEAGHRYFLKGNMGQLTGSPEFKIKFYGGTIKLGGSIMALIDGSETGYTENKVIPFDGAFKEMFSHKTSTTTTSGTLGKEDSSVTTIAPDFLPAETLTKECYRQMFEEWRNLVNAPELPAMDLAEYCYYEMFYFSGIQEGPSILPAKVMKKNCYTEMFAGDNFITSTASYSNLVHGPSRICAVTLAPACFDKMFYACDKLLEAPVLGSDTETMVIPDDLGYDAFLWMFGSRDKKTIAMKKPMIMLNLPKLKNVSLFSNTYGNVQNTLKNIEITNKPTAGYEKFFSYQLVSGTDYGNIFTYGNFFYCFANPDMSLGSAEIQKPKPNTDYYYKVKQ